MMFLLMKHSHELLSCGGLCSTHLPSLKHLHSKFHLLSCPSYYYYPRYLLDHFPRRPVRHVLYLYYKPNGLLLPNVVHGYKGILCLCLLKTCLSLSVDVRTNVPTGNDKHVLVSSSTPKFSLCQGKLSFEVRVPLLFVFVSLYFVLHALARLVS